jgi:cytochrome b subunit of formate dehydrogenase
MRGFLHRLFISCLLLLVLTPAAAQKGFVDPNDPSLFAHPVNPDQGWLQSIGPGHGPVRKNSGKSDVHEDVESFYHARYCLSCHEGQQNNLHYVRTEVVCRDCHVSKPVAGINNPNAATFAAHRHQQVCGKCHEGAGPGMGSYVIHERPPWSQQTRVDFPALYWATLAMLTLAGVVFLFFMPYTTIWAIREARLWLDGRRQDSGASGSPVVVERFSPGARWMHTLLVTCFMVLSVTGIAWMYIETDFGKAMAWPFGGIDGALWIHRLFGLVLVITFTAHIVYLARTALVGRSNALSGPDSLVWTWKDFSAMFQHIAWLLGKREHPVFDRWAWWQKFDYWAVWWGLVIVGTTGLLMFDSVLTTSVLPGWVMNVARWVHKIEAILAMAHIFIVHFFIESYRPSAFPLNAHIFHGAANLQALQHEHPAWIERMRAEGNLEDHLTVQPPRVVQFAFFGFGLAMVGLGLLLLLGMLVFAIDLSL